MRLAIVGNGPYAQMMKKYIDLSNAGEVVSYVVEKQYITCKKINDVEVIPIENIENQLDKNEVRLIMGIGYKQMSNIRKRIYNKCKNMGYIFENYIHPTAIISHDIIMGEGNNILEGVIIEAGVSIGNANLLFGGTLIGHDSIVGDFNTFSVRATTAGCIEVKNNCFFGAASTLKDHIVVNDYAMLGATAYGYKDLEEYSVVVPAKCEILKDKKSTQYL